MRGSGGQSSDSVMTVLSEISKRRQKRNSVPPNINRMLLSDIREKSEHRFSGILNSFFEGLTHFADNHFIFSDIQYNTSGYSMLTPLVFLNIHLDCVQSDQKIPPCPFPETW